MAFAAMAACAASLQPIAQAQGEGAAPSDPQIVGIVVAANNIDIDYGKLALKKSKNKDVKAFAQQMVTDHSALQKAVSDLGAKLNVTPEDSDTSKSLKSQSDEELEKLKSLKGKAFNKAYIDNEVAYHKVVINANDNVLIPNAKNADLKSALEGAKPLFQGHLEHAEKVQSELEGNKKTASKSSY
jgi:Predicted outer membrane protein